jgi:hypothetical protein
VAFAALGLFSGLFIGVHHLSKEREAAVVGLTNELANENEQTAMVDVAGTPSNQNTSADVILNVKD